MRIKTLNYLSTLFFLGTLFSSYILGLFFYDSTTGLDWFKYFNTVGYFLGFDTEITDPQGALYFSFIAQVIEIKTDIFQSNNWNLVLNNSIQLANLIFYLIGICGIAVLFRKKGYRLHTILISLSVLNFLPPALYFRLTMKPEALGFALLPWAIYSLELYFEKRSISALIFSSSIVSILITQKASILGMILLTLLFVFFEEVKNIKNNIQILLAGVFTTALLLYENYKTIGKWLFEKPVPTSSSLADKWNHTANVSFFYNIDFKNLLENPFKHLHSDSMLSITMLDTLSDYFGFFWNHKNTTNYIAYGRINFSENFLIQTFLQQYISIIFTVLFYSLIVFLFIKNIEGRKYLILPVLGLFILIVNSQGFPSRNFDPETGDLFKVHYYSFLVAFTFCFILIHILNNYKYSGFLIILLIPVFLLSIGFPKEVDETTTNGINIRINESEICKLIRGFQNENCNNKMNNYEKNYSRDITKFDKSMVNPKNLNINILIFVMCILSGYLTMCKKE
jgi:hypothetical protein